MKIKVEYIAFGFVALFGLLFLVGGILSGIRTAAFVKTARSVTGEVVENVAIDSKERDSRTHSTSVQTYYYPVIRFVDSTGQQVSFRAKVGSGSPEYSCGDKIAVLYAPQNPSRARIAEGLWTADIFLILFGGGLFALGVVCMIFTARKDIADRFKLNFKSRLAQYGITLTADIIAAGIFGVIGAAMLTGGIIYALHTNALIKRAALAQGTVISLEEATRFERDPYSNSSAGQQSVAGRTYSSSVYHPRVQFTANSGKRIVFRTKSASNPPEYNPGDKVTVLYDPANPADDPKIASFLELWFTSVILSGLGLAFLLSALGIYFMNRHRCIRNSGNEQGIYLSQVK